MPIENELHSVMVRMPRVILPMIIVLLCLSCDEELPVQDNSSSVPPVEWKKPFILTSYTTPDTIFPTPPPRLRWLLNDTTIERLSLWYQKSGSTSWYRLSSLPYADSLEYDVPVNLLNSPVWKFAIATTNGEDMDSTELLTVDKRQVYFVEPVDGALFFRTDSLRIHWRARSEGVTSVTIEIATDGHDNWWHTFPASLSDTIFTWAHPPFTTGECYKLRISPYDWESWTTVERLKYAEFQVNFPRRGDALYRYLPAGIDDNIVIPSCMSPKGPTMYEFSTDGGVSWREVEDGWTVTSKATSTAMLRVTQPTLGIIETTGPFSIEDRSTTFFSVQPGMQMRYRHFGFRSEPSYTDTTWAEWLIVNVDDEITRNGRTVYPCTVTIVGDNGTRTTTSQLLWQDHNGQRIITGDFEPFSMGQIFGLHDISMDEVGGTVVHSKTPDEVDYTSYWTVRGRGMVSAFRTNVVGHVPPKGSGHQYTLLD